MKNKLFLLVTLLLASSSALYAQSGRKSTSSSSSTTTNTPTVSGTKIPEKKTEAAAKVQLLVGIDRTTVSSTPVPYYIFDTVLDNVIRRLGEAENVFANSHGNMSRADGIKAAKQEKNRWVISLEIRSIYQDSGKQVKNNQDELVVDFTVIEPETGKVKHSGQTHQHIYQNGRGGISLPSKNGAIYSEYSIKQAAAEAADRILAGFDITIRPDSQ